VIVSVAPEFLLDLVSQGPPFFGSVSNRLVPSSMIEDVRENSLAVELVQQVEVLWFHSAEMVSVEMRGFGLLVHGHPNPFLAPPLQ